MKSFWRFFILPGLLGFLAVWLCAALGSDAPTAFTVGALSIVLSVVYTILMDQCRRELEAIGKHAENSRGAAASLVAQQLGLSVGIWFIGGYISPELGKVGTALALTAAFLLMKTFQLPVEQRPMRLRWLGVSVISLLVFYVEGMIGRQSIDSAGPTAAQEVLLPAVSYVIAAFMMPRISAMGGLGTVAAASGGQAATAGTPALDKLPIRALIAADMISTPLRPLDLTNQILNSGLTTHQLCAATVNEIECNLAKALGSNRLRLLSLRAQHGLRTLRPLEIATTGSSEFFSAGLECSGRFCKVVATYRFVVIGPTIPVSLDCKEVLAGKNVLPALLSTLFVPKSNPNLPAQPQQQSPTELGTSFGWILCLFTGGGIGLAIAQTTGAIVGALGLTIAMMLLGHSIKAKREREVADLTAFLQRTLVQFYMAFDAQSFDFRSYAAGGSKASVIGLPPSAVPVPQPQVNAGPVSGAISNTAPLFTAVPIQNPIQLSATPQPTVAPLSAPQPPIAATPVQPPAGIPIQLPATPQPVAGTLSAPQVVAQPVQQSAQPTTQTNSPTHGLGVSPTQQSGTPTHAAATVAPATQVANATPRIPIQNAIPPATPTPPANGPRKQGTRRKVQKNPPMGGPT